MSSDNHQRPLGPVGASHQVSTHVESGDRINQQHVSSTDWSQCCLPIGVAVKSAVPLPWEGASEEDLRLLAGLLLKPLTLVLPSGVVQSPALSDASPFLRQLGQWARGAAQWCAEHPEKLRE